MLSKQMLVINFLFFLSLFSSTLQAAVATLEIWTNNLPMPDPITIYYDPTITTNHDLFMQIQAATGNPPDNLIVQLGAGLVLPDNHALVDQTKFLMRNATGKPKIVAITKV